MRAATQTSQDESLRFTEVPSEKKMEGMKRMSSSWNWPHLLTKWNQPTAAETIPLWSYWMHIQVDCMHASLVVTIERTKLDLVSGQSGMPKGSVLGPLLFKKIFYSGLKREHMQCRNASDWKRW